MALRQAAQVLLVSAVSLWSGLAFAHGTHGAHDEGSGERMLVRYQLSDYEHSMRAIGRLHIDLAGVDVNAKVADIIATDELHAKIRAIKGISVLKSIPTSAVDAPDAGYHTASEVATAVQNFANEHSDIVRVESIGKSLEGRDIWAIKITDNPDQRETDEPVILYNSMHHAREVMTTEVAIDTADYLTRNYGKDPTVNAWVNNNEIWIVPMLNVDGNNKVWTSNSMWRKNTRNGHGVDLNRNYPFKWNACGGSSGSTWSDTYRGASAGSEPETQALMGLVERIRPVFNISYHSYSEMVLYPYGCDGEHTPTRDIVAGIGKKMAQSLPSDNGNKTYTYGTPWELLYAVDGGDVDWMYGNYGIIPYVIELSSTREGFQPSYSTWRDKTVAKLRAAWGLLLDRVEGSGVRGIVNVGKGRKPSDIVVKLESLEKPMLVAQSIPLAADGTFHFVVEPGLYSVSLTDGQFTLPPNNVQVSDRRIDLELEF